VKTFIGTPSLARAADLRFRSTGFSLWIYPVAWRNQTG